MLIIMRKIDEAIWLGDDIKIMVVGFPKGKRVAIGIDAPDTVAIAREELLGPGEKPKRKEERR